MTERKALEVKAKELGVKPSKDLIKAAKAIDKMRAIVKNANISPVKEYLKDKYGK